MSNNGRMVNVEVSTENMDQLIEGHIRVAMLEALSEDSSTLIERVVKLAMNQECKKSSHNHYSNNKKTHFGCELEDMVREAAGSMFKDWLKEHHTLIRGAIEKRLNQAPKKFVNDIAKAVVDGLAENLQVKASLKVDNDRY
ncbi:MAG: hypothetical protein V3V08_05690 [Nannocystaceae bacterium]